MKWLIGIIVIALIAWGVWWAKNNTDTVENDTGANNGQVQGAQSQTASSTYDLGEFQDKG
jgi:hypothetical protein